jgi:hypothetical protein
MSSQILPENPHCLGFTATSLSSCIVDPWIASSLILGYIPEIRTDRFSYSDSNIVPIYSFALALYMEPYWPKTGIVE